MSGVIWFVVDAGSWLGSELGFWTGNLGMVSPCGIVWTFSQHGGLVPRVWALEKQGSNTWTFYDVIFKQCYFCFTLLVEAGVKVHLGSRGRDMDTTT